jgi:hypothetical protein
VSIGMSMNNNNHVRESIPCLYACCIYVQIAIFELFLKPTHTATNKINNCITDNSSLDFR